MPLLRANSPPSLTHQRFSRGAVIALSIIGIALGAWAAKDCASIRFGYAAGYNYAAAWVCSIALCVVGLLLLVYWRTRGFGAGLIAAGILTFLTFYSGMEILLRLDRVAWQHEPPPVAIGPDQKATLVVYFRVGTTNKQIEEFASSLEEDTADQSLLREYLRLIPSQANGHDAVALTLNEDASPEQIARYVERIEHDRRVEKTYRNIAPIAIQPEPNHTP